MVTHYSSNGSEIACGRNTPKVVSCASPEQVTCKSCLRSLAKADAPAVANKAPSLADIRKQKAQASQPKAAPARFDAKAQWRARLAELPGRSRLPRGTQGTQRFV
ncbi:MULTISPECIES: hypothetical protein [Pseudomonas]|uniref:Uncharacterized protein n=1 Tax=Pseudomonas eucalypticola TaxID=2599595 RepID=A0A7D5HEE8_9PSED|nr:MULTISPECIES: hypothetical protein [Pseudomonas]QKZ05430.1 hypothetical protein HWQ56_17155 [Pseudomonas eucalypticola]